MFQYFQSSSILSWTNSESVESNLITTLTTFCAPSPQNMERVYSLYQTFPEGQMAEVDVPKNPYSREVVLQPVSPTHLSVCQRLRKVIQELVDTEKSYVKVSYTAVVVLLRVPALLLLLIVLLLQLLLKFLLLLLRLIVLPSLLLALFQTYF